MATGMSPTPPERARRGYSPSTGVSGPSSVPHDIALRGPGRPLLQCAQRLHCVRGAFERHEQMIVMDAGDDVATDACLAERTRECRGESDRIERRMHRQRDPRGAEGDVQSEALRRRFRHDDRQALGFADRREDLVAVDRRPRRKQDEREATRLEFRLQGRE
jgi:hypothetical protein